MPEPADQLVTPQLCYERPAEALDWLCGAFGFTVASRITTPDGGLAFAVLHTPKGGVLMLGGILGGAPGHALGAGYSITVFVDDVDAHHATASQAGATVTQALTDQPWGLRDYEATDLEGRQWNFSQRLHAVRPEDWGATSG